MWVGLFLITFIDIKTLVEDGPEPVLLYNPDTFVLFMGAVVVCFEGIALVLPLRDSMDSHDQVPFKSISWSIILLGVGLRRNKKNENNK